MIAEQLKKAVLQAAIQGKLTKQLPEDGDAGDLLNEIRAEKARLVKAGKLKKEKPLPEISEDEIPFEIPENWVWVRLGELSKVISKGTTPSGGKNSYSPSGIGFVRAENVGSDGKVSVNDIKFVDEKTHNTFLKRSILLEKDLLICIAGTLGRAAVVESNQLPLNANQAVAFVRLVNTDIFSVHYLQKAITSFPIQQYLLSQTKVTAIPNLTLEIIRKCTVPLPPLSEQKRIIEMLEEVLPEIDKLALDEKKLDELEKAFPKKVKDAILQYAIQGKLTDQRPEDGNAKDLLKEIRAEKARLVKAGKLKKENPLPEISEDEIPFDIPESWVWARLGKITYNHGQKKPDKMFTYIDIGSVDNTRNILKDTLSVLASNEAPSRARKIVYKDDIIYATVRPYLHNTCRIHKLIEPEPIVSTGFEVLTSPIIQVNDYLSPFLLSPFFDSYANDQDNSKGVAYPAINNEKFYKAVVPLPPLAEQKRIVERLEHLLPLCEKLE